MPIDVQRVVGAELPETAASWSPDDVILYHLGLGAGARPTDPADLEYVYEERLKVLPTYGVIPALDSLLAMLRMPGMQVDLAKLLHGEHELEIHEPLPTSAEVSTSARVTGVYDKGRGALVVLETVTCAAGSERKLFTNRFKAFVRGEGGFGGNGGPAPAAGAPDRTPDRVVEVATLPQQALLYRLSGDRNPMHADPEFARRGGFDQPILHGLCSYGIVCRAVVDTLLDGDVARIAAYRARFAGVVFPGETLVVRMWRDPDAVLVDAHTKERGTPVIANAAIALRRSA